MSPTCFGDLGDYDIKGRWGNEAKYKDILQGARLFPFRSIQKATKNFSSVLASDHEYSDSYEGILENRTVVVQVFRHDKTKTSRRVRVWEFIQLVRRMPERHRNAGVFIGCCIEGKHRVAVYEFVENQRLDKCYEFVERQHVDRSYEFDLQVRRFSYTSIQKATNDFSTSELDIHPSCNFYEADLENRTVLVQVIEHVKGQDFIYMVNKMSQIKHRNVVGFIGCCLEGNHRIVVYEFVGRQSLYQLIHYGTKIISLELSWKIRASICVGVARGLDYLHNVPFAHGNITSSNIILDENYNPKIIFESDAYYTSQSLAMDLEHSLTKMRHDVFCFGILLSRMVDMLEDDFREDEVIRFIEVAQSCVQRSPELRPSMNDVLYKLSNAHLPVDDKNLGEIEIPVGSNVSSTDNYHKASKSEIVSLGSGASVPTTDTKGKMVCVDEIQIEEVPETSATTAQVTDTFMPSEVINELSFQAAIGPSSFLHPLIYNDKLKGRDVKTCFLYSALFPTDKEIDISMLVDCFIAEGLLGGRTVVSYKRGHDIIEQLINARLLEPTENSGMVKMPNVIRDSALAILSSDIEGYQVFTRYYLRPSTTPTSKRVEVQKYLTGAGAQLKEPPALEEWTTAEMILLMDNEFSRLPDKPTCPNLQALFLQRNSCLRVIPTSFFDGMGGLRILNLSKTRIKSLPDSFLTLENLEVLAMRDCERFLTLPPSIGRHLKALQVLDLEGTELTHLPDSISELASLKNLRVSFYGLINPSNSRDLPAKLIPDETIMTLDLQELGMFVHPGDRRWASCVSNIIKEINNLKLSSLCFHFPEIDHLDHFLNKNTSWKNGYLTMFNFIVGRDFQHVVSQVPYDAEMMYSGEERCLRYVNGEDIPPAVQVVLSRVTSFYLDHHLSVCSLSDFGIERMHALKICILRDCPKLTNIIGNDYGTTVLPFLEYLSINYLWNLEQIWTAYLGMSSLAKLKYLSIHACPKLRYVFTWSMLDILPNLEELVIEDCAMMEYIVIEEKLARSPILRSLKVLKLHYLPELSGIWKGRWPSLEYISFYNCPKLKNLHLLGNDAVSIKKITADKSWWDSLEWNDMAMSTRLQKLVTQIEIDDM